MQGLPPTGTAQGSTQRATWGAGRRSSSQQACHCRQPPCRTVVACPAPMLQAGLGTGSVYLGPVIRRLGARDVPPEKWRAGQRRRAPPTSPNAGGAGLYGDAVQRCCAIMTGQADEATLRQSGRCVDMDGCQAQSPRTLALRIQPTLPHHACLPFQDFHRWSQYGGRPLIVARHWYER